MKLRDLFKPKGAAASGAHTIDDLIVLERYPEAENLLRKRLQNKSSDRRARRKLAELYARQGRAAEAAAEFALTADGYEQDGFHDKAMALLSKAAKLLPGSVQIQERLDAIRQAKQADRRGERALAGFRAGGKLRAEAAGSGSFELQRAWPRLRSCPLMSNLDGDQIEYLFREFELVSAGEGTIVASPEKDYGCVFLIGEGGVEALLDESRVLRAFEPGDLIGESTLLERRPWPAIYRTKGKVLLFMLDRAGLERVLQGNADPRQLLEALRCQRLDTEVLASMAKVKI